MVQANAQCFGRVVKKKATGQERALLKWNFHLGQAAGCRGVHGGYDPVDLQPNKRPLRRAQHDKGDAASREVLLIAYAVVRRQKDVETSALPLGQQVTVAQPVPTPVFGFSDPVPG